MLFKFISDPISRTDVRTRKDPYTELRMTLRIKFMRMFTCAMDSGCPDKLKYVC